MAGVALYASLFEPPVARLDLHALPASHRQGPHFLNVQRFLDLPQAAAMAADSTPVVLYDDAPQQWDWPMALDKKLAWEKKIRHRPAVKPEGE